MGLHSTSKEMLMSIYARVNGTSPSTLAFQELEHMLANMGAQQAAVLFSDHLDCMWS